jgi:hypothetical protein
VGVGDLGECLRIETRRALGSAFVHLGGELVGREVGEGLQTLAGGLDAILQTQPVEQLAGLLLDNAGELDRGAGALRI